MTQSEEETSSLALLEQLAHSDVPTVQKALRAIKHRLIGHDQNKDLFVQHGVIDPLIRILNSSGGTLSVWAEARVEAGIAIGSLAYGGETFILHMLSRDVLIPLTASLEPSSCLPKLIVSSLRTLNTMLDTCFSPSAPVAPAATLAAALYTPRTLQCLRDIIAQDDSNGAAQQQISLAASLIAKSCGRNTTSQPPVGTIAHAPKSHQEMLVEAGLLDVLARRLVSFNLPERMHQVLHRKSEDVLPPPAPAMAKLAPILDAISAIVQGSKIHALEFLFSPSLLAVFPPLDPSGASTLKVETSGGTSTFLPQPRPVSRSLMQPPQHIITPAAFPPLPAAGSSSTHFPPLSASSSSHAMSFPALHHFHSQHSLAGTMSDSPSLLLHTGLGADDSESPTGISTPPRRRADASDVEDDDRMRPMHLNTDKSDLESPEPEVETEETGFVNWLVSLVRSGSATTRLAAAGLITDFHLLGMTGNLLPMLRLLVVPVIVRLLDDDQEGNVAVGPGCTGVGGIDARTWNRWMVEEKAPAILARLVKESPELQRAAVVDAKAIEKLVGVLRRASASSQVGAANGELQTSYGDRPPSRNRPEYMHRMRLKEGTLLCLANLTLAKDEYRKIVIEEKAVQIIVSACLTPLPQTPARQSESALGAEGNPPSVLAAACSVIRSVSRSVSILRTSLIDAGVAYPVFSLLKHENVAVQIAAVMCVCNLVVDFSPMRKPIIDAGVIDVLCDLAKSRNPALRLNAVWALKHLVYELDPDMKRKIFFGLKADYIMEIISNPGPILQEDAEMQDSDPDVYAERSECGISSFVQQITDGRDPTVEVNHLPPKATRALQLLRQRASVAPVTAAKKEQIALQEQGIEFLRNFVCESSTEVAATMIDTAFDAIGADRLLSLLEALLDAPDAPGEIINAVVHVVVHLSAGAPKHRLAIIHREKLMNSLSELWNHRMRDVRNAVVWVIISLTWVDEGEDAQGLSEIQMLLKQMGWVERLRDMRKDVELDVRERVKTAEYQLGVPISSRP